MKNYFEIFSLPTKFNIDFKALEETYLQFQQKFHPDNQISNADFNSIENSILINEAYKVLSDDFYRGNHLLQLKNIDIESDENPIKPDIATLQEVLNLQEKISEITNLVEISALKNSLNSTINILMQKFCEAFEDNKINDATQFLIKTKYLKKSLQDLKNKEKNLK